MFSFTKKSFSFKVYITGNREFLPRKPQIYLIYSSKLQEKKKNRLHALWILHLKNKKRGVYEPCNSSYTPFIEIVNYRL